MAQHGDFGDTSVTVCSLSGWVGGGFHYFLSFFSISSTCQVGHLDLEILLSHISSNFCDVFCWTLQIFINYTVRKNRRRFLECQNTPTVAKKTQNVQVYFCEFEKIASRNSHPRTFAVQLLSIPHEPPGQVPGLFCTICKFGQKI